jgi:hypothetical protein
VVHKLVRYCLDSCANCLAVRGALPHWGIFYMLKYLQNYCLRRCPRARLQNIDQLANKMVVFANRPYIDTYLFVINIGYLLQRLRLPQVCGFRIWGWVSTVRRSRGGVMRVPCP